MNDFDFQPTDDSVLDTLLHEVKAEVAATDDFFLPDEMVLNAVRRACDFFCIPEVPVINANGTCVWPNNPDTYSDDVFGFNREQLMQLGISGEDSLTLLYTHECAHRTLQGAYNDSWEEELACDFFAGIHAGIKGINLDNFEASLGTTTGGDSHPNGALRTEFLEYGQKIAKEMQDRHIEVTYDRCIEYINNYIEDKGGLIAEYRMRVDPNYSGLAGNKITSSNDEVNGISFTRKYTDAEINKMKSDVSRLEYEVSCRKSDVANWESKVSLNNNKEHKANGDYANAVSRLNEAKVRYNNVVDRLNSAKVRLNNAT